jgi:hypothetical protein
VAAAEAASIVQQKVLLQRDSVQNSDQNFQPLLHGATKKLKTPRGLKQHGDKVLYLRGGVNSMRTFDSYLCSAHTGTVLSNCRVFSDIKVLYCRPRKLWNIFNPDDGSTGQNSIPRTAQRSGERDYV